MTDREALFWAKVDRGGPDECWPWLGTKSKGYGRTRYEGRSEGAHRVAYRLTRGTIPKGLSLDHLCRNPSCCNPAHLEAVPNRVNVLRGVGVTAVNFQKTHCDNGHEYSEENTRWYKERDSSLRRFCLECKRHFDRVRQRERRAAAKAAGHCGRCCRPPERCHCGPGGRPRRTAALAPLPEQSEEEAHG